MIFERQQEKFPGQAFSLPSPNGTCLALRFQRKMCPRRRDMTLGTILLIVLILLLIGAIPTWPYSRGWGYAPTGGLGLVLVIVIILLLLGVL